MPTLYLDHDPTRLVLKSGRKTNTHDLPMKYLRNAATVTRKAAQAGQFAIISYDPDGGEIIAGIRQHEDSSSFLHYPLIFVTVTPRQLSMQEIADRVAEATQDAQELPF